MLTPGTLSLFGSQRVTTKGDGVTTDIAIQFVTYGTKGFGDRSGAYLFLPDGPATVGFIVSLILY